MTPLRSWKRSVGLATLVAVACTALQAATPNLDRVLAKPMAVARDARLAGQKPRSALPQASVGASLLRAVGFSGETGRTSAGSSRRAELLAQADQEVHLEPWSLILGALSVMIFIAARRRPD